MNENHFSDVSELDYIRKSEGLANCKTAFIRAYRRNKREAAALLNNQLLTFPCLYFFLPQLETLQLFQLLNLRNRTALRIIPHIQKSSKSVDRVNYLSEKNSTAYSTLLWMFQTGFSEEGQSSDYEEILDVTVSVLINLYHDVSILHHVAELIFKRSRQGRNIHNLAWAFLRVRDPHTLRLIAQRMDSSDEHDRELASNLLNLPHGITADNREKYEGYLNWLEENDPYLYFTDESFQFTSNPVFYNIDLERKYLHKGTPTYSKEPAQPAGETESKYLEAFQTRSDDEKAVLSEYSHRLQRENPFEWESWIRDPIEEQIAVATTKQGVAQWL